MWSQRLAANNKYCSNIGTNIETNIGTNIVTNIRTNIPTEVSMKVVVATWTIGCRQQTGKLGVIFSANRLTLPLLNTYCCLLKMKDTTQNLS